MLNITRILLLTCSLKFMCTTPATLYNELQSIQCFSGMLALMVSAKALDSCASQASHLGVVEIQLPGLPNNSTAALFNIFGHKLFKGGRVLYLGASKCLLVNRHSWVRFSCTERKQLHDSFPDLGSMNEWIVAHWNIRSHNLCVVILIIQYHVILMYVFCVIYDSPILGLQ